MKKLIFSFFFGLFLLTSSQMAYTRRGSRPEISFDIESVISINTSIGNTFVANDNNDSKTSMHQNASATIDHLNAKFPFLANYSISH